MITVVFRLLKRFVVLLPALFVAYLSVFNIFPELNEHLPVLAAGLITYILGAYVLVPALIRVARIVFPPRHVPLYCVTADGFASDPLNIALIGTRQQVVNAMTAAGWYEAEPLTPRSVIRIILSTVYKWRYPTGPMSHLYLFGRKQDIGFQLPAEGNSADRRHHVRFWATTYNALDDITVRTIRRQRRQTQLQGDTLLWLGAASFDIGITFIRHNAQFTHLVDPNTDAERDLLVGQLQTAGVAKLHTTIQLTEPYRLVNIHALCGHLETDAQLKVMQLTGVTKTGSSPGSTKPTPLNRQ